MVAAGDGDDGGFLLLPNEAPVGGAHTQGDIKVLALKADADVSSQQDLVHSCRHRHKVPALGLDDDDKASVDSRNQRHGGKLDRLLVGVTTTF